MKPKSLLLILAIFCGMNVSTFAQLNPVPRTVCQILISQENNLNVVTVGMVTAKPDRDEFALTFDGCTVICDGKNGQLPPLGWTVAVQGRLRDDAIEHVKVDVQYWQRYEEEPSSPPDPIVFTVEDALDSPEGTVAALFGRVINYQDATNASFADDTPGSIFVDFPDSDDKPAVQENVNIRGVVEFNNAENPVIDITYWYPEGGAPPPQPLPVAWTIAEAYTQPEETICFIKGQIESWTDQEEGLGNFTDGLDMIPINFDTLSFPVPNLAEDIFILGKTNNSFSPLDLGIDAIAWFPAALVGSNDLNIANSKIKIFPNPVNDMLYFETEREISRAILYNDTGEIVSNLKRQFGNSGIDVSNLMPGVYMLTLYDGDALVGSQRVLIIN